jgi:N-acetylneuraminic acid mutarotase
MRGADADSPVPPGWGNPWSEPYNSEPYYGTLGNSGAHTGPGGRNSSAYWTDKSGNFWLFGGEGLDGSAAVTEGLLNDLWKYSPATNEWTWIGGSSMLPSYFRSCSGGVVAYCGLPGVYGTQGVASLSNIPGGRLGAVTWTDGAGNFWLFGGLGADSVGNEGYLNDLWKFNPSTEEWIWVSGSSTVGKNPEGQEGVYGTKGIADPRNVPPGLTEATGWVDSNENLWLFGGIGIASQGGMGYSFNNLWKFNTATNEWIWISGNGGGESADYGTYGTMGTSAPSNIPSGRNGAVSWTDSSGNFWLFGGSGVYPASQATISGDLNDLWEFIPGTGQWTWIAGTAGGVLNPHGGGYFVPPYASYGTQGVTASSNTPGGRDSAMGWADKNGNLWLLGGAGVDSTGYAGAGPLNDLWKYNLTSKEWTWVNGADLSYAGGVYGTEGTPAAGNTPGSRYSSAVWMDASGNAWIFAGWGMLYGVVGGATTLNDLWRYQP